MPGKSTFLDMNFWFAKGVGENQDLKKMIENTSSTIGGYNIWSDLTEESFLPDIFTTSTLFKLLYSDTTIDFSFQNIHHKVSPLMLADLEYLPRQLKYTTDVYFGLNSMSVIKEDIDNVLVSILIDQTNELTILGLLRDAKKFTFETDPAITSLPIPLDDFLTSYVSNIDTFTALSKLIIIDLFYLHYGQSDEFQKYQMILTIITGLESTTGDKPYALMCILYGYMVMNKILQQKILSVPTNTYQADYWSNDQ